jgi:PIN domain nuclease of toxin-antitoxin system
LDRRLEGALMPPQARSFASAILHRDPGSRRIISQSLRQKLPELVSGR